jgi:hypothetical protein
MATAQFLIEAKIERSLGPSCERVIEITRPGRAPWELVLPAQLDQGDTTAELVAFVTAQYLAAVTAKGGRIRWEMVYAVVKMTLEQAVA